MKLAGKAALVTGGARGIGRGCALALARAGAELAINDRELSAETESAVREIEAMGRKAVAIAGNAFDRAGCESILSDAISHLGKVDILVSNPAFSRRGPFLEYSPELFEKSIQGTLIGGFHMSQLVSRHLVERSTGGKIIFISSVHARIPYVNSAAYNAAKSGLNHFAATIAAELVAYRINVNVIEPGWIETPGEHTTFGADAIREAGPKLPWGRIGTPDDIGKAAAFLASDDADYITGTCLPVDGGFLLRAAGAGG